jgi:AcrR family transcriptional regulator
MEILEADGLDALTLQRVAQALGLVTTAIYRYFPSKDALMAALQRRAVRAISEHFQSELAALSEPLAKTSPPTAGLATLLMIGELYLALPRTHPNEWRFVARLLGDPKQLLSDDEAARTAPLLEGFLRSMAAVFAHAEDTEALASGDAGERVFAFWSALHGAHCMEKLRRVAPGAPSVDDIGRCTTHALLASWGATPARLTAARELTKKLDPTGKRKFTVKKGSV